MGQKLFILLLWLPLFSWAETPLDPASLEAAVAEKRAKVAEFAKIAELAQSRGLRAFLLGGTAATFVHYVKGDVQRAAGDPAFQNARTDYDLTSMFRGTQDLDIVITRADGSPETAAEITAFRNLVARKVRSHRGKTTAWEIRGLKTTVGTKEAIARNFNFLNQNTDTQSTGLVELTKSSQPTVTDLRGDAFLVDAAAGKIRFLRSPSHFSTTRASQGENPEIISALRFLSKAFQFGLQFDPESREKITAILSEFTPQRSYSDYVRKRIEFEAKKIFLHSQDLPRSHREALLLGLKEKLAPFAGDAGKEGTLGWLMAKKPAPRLGQSPVGGRTARDMGIHRVTHATPTFEAFLSLTAAPSGVPNALSSRMSGGGPDELAAYGEGYYTLSGEKGMSRRALHHYDIVHDVDPNARFGIDFTKVGDNYFLFKNMDSLRVVPEKAEPVHFQESICLRAMRGLGLGGHRVAALKFKARVAWAIARALPPQATLFLGGTLLYSAYSGYEQYSRWRADAPKRVCENSHGGWRGNIPSQEGGETPDKPCFCFNIQSHINLKDGDCNDPRQVRGIIEVRFDRLEKILEQRIAEQAQLSYKNGDIPRLRERLEVYKPLLDKARSGHELNKHDFGQLDELRVDLLQNDGLPDHDTRH